MMRWTRIAALGIVAFAVITYGADWAVYKFGGSPKSRYTVNYFVSAPLNNKNQEIDYTGSKDVPCSLTAYPQEGFPPCWYLRRHLNQTTTY
jgi:hypothetical protein